MEKTEKLTIPLALSQTTTSETYDRKNVTAAFTLICLKIAEKVLELQPVSDAEIAGTFILTTLSTFHWTYGERCSLNLLDYFLDDLKTL